MDEDDFTYSFETMKSFISNGSVVAHWLPAFLLAVLLRLITSKYHHQLVFPACKDAVVP